MMNAQIPSGLQALLQASQVLQQQAAPTAPGPQGPQPTVASKVNQQIQQTAMPQDVMPGMRDMGQQAGIAGQIMAQRQAQQQQMAQNPQAVAQMAAQMLQGQGVAGLPSNMQFKEGGIIAFEEGDLVPEADEEEKRRRIGRLFRRSDSEIDLGEDVNRDDSIPPEAALAARAPSVTRPQPGPSRDRMTDERMDTELGRAYRGETADRQGIRRALEYTFKDLPVKAGSALLSGAETAAKHLVSAPGHGISALMEPPRVVPSAGAEPSAVWTPKPGEKKGGISGGPAGEKPPKPPVETGIAAVQPPTVPKAEMPTRPDLQAAINKYQKPENIKKTEEELQSQDAAILARRLKAPEFEEQGIAALNRANQERQQQLAQSRAGDDWTRLRAFFRDLATRGNNYDIVQAGMDARDAGATKASLAHEQAVIELRKAKEARELGNMELARTHKANALAFLKDERKIAQDLAKIDLQSQEAYDKMTATERTNLANRESNTQLEMSRQAHASMLKLGELKEQARQRNDRLLYERATEAQRLLNDATKRVEETLKSEFPDKAYLTDPARLRKLQARANELKEQLIDPAQALADSLSAKVLGPEGGGVVFDGILFPNQASVDAFKAARAKRDAGK